MDRVLPPRYSHQAVQTHGQRNQSAIKEQVSLRFVAREPHRGLPLRATVPLTQAKAWEKGS